MLCEPVEQRSLGDPVEELVTPGHHGEQAMQLQILTHLLRVGR
jgi:hypothetical protein